MIITNNNISAYSVWIVCKEGVPTTDSWTPCLTREKARRLKRILRNGVWGRLDTYHIHKGWVYSDKAVSIQLKREY